VNYDPTDYRLKLERLGIKHLLPIDRIIYKYTSYETALKIIETNSLKFSPPKDFNDPFDLTTDLIGKSYTHSDLRDWLKSIPNLSTDDKKKIFDETKANPKKIKDMFDKALDQNKDLFGISCFSKTYQNVLMWSHYANKHSGVCLGFNIMPVDPSKEFALLEVNYVNEIKPLNYFKNQSTVFLYWIFTKSDIWSYEEEVRAVHMSRNGLINFDYNCLKEIHFGLRTSDQEVKYLQNKIADLGYSVGRFTKMEINPSTFRLKSKELI